MLLIPPAPAAAAGAARAAAGEGEAQPEDITDEDARELRYFSPTDGTR